MWSDFLRWKMHGRSWRSSASITIISLCTARWRTVHQQPSRSCTGLGREKLVHRWGAHHTRLRGRSLPKLSSYDWYRNRERFNCPNSLVSIGTEKGDNSNLSYHPVNGNRGQVSE